MNEPYFRYRLYPGYKANRRSAPPRAPRQPRAPAQAAPLLRVSFIMPASIAFAVAPGLHHSGVDVSPLNTASVGRQTNDAKLPFSIAAAFLQEVSKGHPPYSVAVQFTTSAEPGREWWRMTYLDGHVLVARTSDEPMVFTGRG